MTIASLLVEQGAFTGLPLILTNLPPGQLRGLDNSFYTAMILLSLCVTVICLMKRYPPALALWRVQWPMVAFTLLVCLSVMWSAYPEITLRRSLSYVLTTLVATNVFVSFEGTDRLRVLASSFYVAAVGSIVFTVLFPQHGIMHGPELEGAWRGVFFHKNVFGPAMSIGLFVQLFLIASSKRAAGKRLVPALMFLALVLLSKSATALVASAMYIAAYVGWRLIGRRTIGYLFVLLALMLISLAVLVIAWADLAGVLQWFGKDPTMTGRTTLWREVLNLISERPFLGWGYQATWQPADNLTVGIDRKLGDWGVTNAQNTFLEVTLQLGLFGSVILALLLGRAMARSIKCLFHGMTVLGWFSIILLIAALVVGQTEITLGQNQNITWVVVLIVSFLVSVPRTMPRVARVPDQPAGCNTPARDGPSSTASQVTSATKLARNHR